VQVSDRILIILIDSKKWIVLQLHFRSFEIFCETSLILPCFRKNRKSKLGIGKVQLKIFYAFYANKYLKNLVKIFLFMLSRKFILSENICLRNAVYCASFWEFTYTWPCNREMSYRCPKIAPNVSFTWTNDYHKKSKKKKYLNLQSKVFNV
jgi:hypothetical protein